MSKTPKPAQQPLTFGNPTAGHTEAAVIAFTDIQIGKKWSFTIREGMTMSQVDAALEMLEAATDRIVALEDKCRQAMAKKRQAAKEEKATAVDAQKYPVLPPAKVRDILRQNAKVGKGNDLTVAQAIAKNTLHADAESDLASQLSELCGGDDLASMVLYFLFGRSIFADLAVAEFNTLAQRMQFPNAETEFAAIAAYVGGGAT